jgi:hypothetical protein
MDTDAMGTPCWKIWHTIDVKSLFKIIGPLLIGKNLTIGQSDSGRVHRYEDGLYEYTSERYYMGVTVFMFRRSEYLTPTYSLEWAERYNKISLYRGDSLSKTPWDSQGKMILTQKDSIPTCTSDKDYYSNSTFLRLASIIDYLVTP